MTRFTSPATTRPAKPDDGCWMKSTFSTAACTCVEVRLDHHGIALRDSKYVSSNRFHRQPTIQIPATEWSSFLDEVIGRALPGTNRVVTIRVTSDGGASVRCHSSGTALWFNALEWRAFTLGVVAGEFSLRLAA